MAAVISFLVVLVISILVVRIATVALTLTGLSQHLARFQARSAFTGAGFTTAESEKVVQHPVRRRIIMLLMLLGNAGIVTAITSLIISFAGTDESSGGFSAMARLLILFVGLAALWMVAHSSWVDRHMSRLIAEALKRWTDLEVRDYAGLLHLTGGYVVAELTVEHDDWLTGRSLQNLKLADEGVLVLGVERADGTYIGAPRGQTVLNVDDRALLYGHQDALSNLDERRRGALGNWEHHKAVNRQLELEQEAQDDSSHAGD
jgi:hypothetical protein